MSAGRNVATELETTVERLGRATWEADEEWCRARLAELYEGGVEAFGPMGPSRDELLEAHLWFLLDCTLPDGETPLWRLSFKEFGRSCELLARSELRAWRIESQLGPKLLAVIGPRRGERSRLELARAPAGDPTPGRWMVARSVPLGPERWLALGRPPVVAPGAEPEFEQLLESLDAPRGEFWRVHGGVLARAAQAWPEWREHTIDGQIVMGSLASLELRDRRGAIAAIDGDAELEDAPDRADPGSHAWRWRWDPPVARRPPAEPGVRFRLCEEDADRRPWLAGVDVEPADPRLWLLAPTPKRLALAERLLRLRLGDLVGAVLMRDFLPPNVTPRWKVERSRTRSETLDVRGRRAAGHAA